VGLGPASLGHPRIGERNAAGGCSISRKNVSDQVQWNGSSKPTRGKRPTEKLMNGGPRRKGCASSTGAKLRAAGADGRFRGKAAGHSLRSGFLTSAAAYGASIFKMADQSRHKSMDTLRGYVRDAEIFKDHAGNGLL